RVAVAPNVKQRIADADDLISADMADGHAFLTVEQWGQWQYDLGDEYGEETGMKMAAQIIEQRAIKLFTQEKDAEARKLRELAKELIKIADERRVAKVNGRKAKMEH